MDSRHPETIALHAGWRSDAATTSVAVPIYQTSGSQFNPTAQAGRLVGPEPAQAPRKLRPAAG